MKFSSRAKSSRLKLSYASALLILLALPSWAGTWNTFGPKSYTRPSGSPVTVTDTFSVRNAGVQYTLHLQNGGLQDDVNDFVSSTVITINGAVVVGPNDINQNTATLDRAVQLQAGANTIAVQLRGKPGGQLAVTIIGVDNDPPTIQATATPAANAASWNNTAVTVSYACNDATSGVASCAAPVTVTGEGAAQVITGQAVDLAGNTASASVTLNIDLTAPVIVPSLSPPANSFGWNNSNVTVSFACSDALSGVATCAAPVSFAAEGAGQVASGAAIDRAGNSASASATVNIDKTPPAIMAAISPAPDARGIVTLPSTGAATVTFTCADTGSGIASCPSPIQVNVLGANQTFSGTAADKAGNTAVASITFSVEAAPLAVSASSAPAANANGWNNTAVTVSYQCTGGVPPIQCPASQTVSTEGASQSVSATAIDAAGQTASATAVLKIDLTPPAISASVSPNPAANGVVNATSATVTFTCSDALSGVLTCPSPVTVTTTGLQTISGTAVDQAGNTASASLHFTLQPFPPLVVTATAAPVANAAGWNNTPVTVAFTCTGGVPPVFCPNPQVVNADGANQIITATANDSSGQSVDASVTVSLDQSAPLVSITSPKDGATLPTPSVTITGSASDSGSGLASVSCNGAPATITLNSFSCSTQIVRGAIAISVQAVDAAGNSAATTVSVNLAGPALTITSPGSMDLFSSNTISVTGTVDDPAALIKVNEMPATIKDGVFVAQGVSLREGSNLIAATAINSGGGVSTSSVTVVLDTTPPTVHVDSPADGALLTSPQIMVSGLVNDVVTGTVNAAQVSVVVNGVKAEVANRSFMAAGVLLVPGQNVITAVAKDRAGNVSQSQVRVTLQDVSNQQRVLVVSGDNQLAPVGTSLSNPLVVQVVNAPGQPLVNVPVTFSVLKSDAQLFSFPQHGRQITVQTDANGQASATLQVGSRVGNGNNQVSATAPGFAGNVVFVASSTVGPAVQIHDISGASQKGVLGQPLPEPLVAGVFDAGGNPVAGAKVTFTVAKGGGTVEGSIAVTKTTDADGRAAVVLVLAQEEGINNNAVSASFEGLTGPPAAFTASGLAPTGGLDTRVSGIVLDNANQPIPNATASIKGTNLSSLTNAQGQFTISNAPVGSVVLFIDGSSSSRPESFPFLEFPMVTVAGQDNTLSGPIFLPPLDMENSKFVGGDEDVTLTLKGNPGVAYTVFAHSATFPDGSRQGRLTLSQVHSDKVPMAPPNGTAPSVVGTLQPARVKFDPPIRIQVPNSSGLPAGQVVEVYSYDHDLEQFVSGGTARVSEDGAVIVSDPAFGLRVSGWHTAPPPPPPPTCANGCDTGDPCRKGQCVNGSCQYSNQPDGTKCTDDGNNCTEDVCKAGSCTHQKPGITVKIESSNSDPSNPYVIDTTPQMPQNLQGKARVTGVDPDPTDSTSFHWETKIRWKTVNGVTSVDQDLVPVDVTGEKYTPTYVKVSGGDLTAKASIVKGGTVCASQEAKAKIGGKNPSTSDVDAELGGHTSSPAITLDVLKKIACQESSKRQFYDSTRNKVPCQHAEPDGRVGAGILQVTLRNPSDAVFWNWRTNIGVGVGILEGKRADAQGYPARVRRRRGGFPEATDFTEAQLQFEMVKRFNGGRYWSWVRTGPGTAPGTFVGQWVASPTAPNVSYADDVMAQPEGCRVMICL
jgi:hypothetical protein